MSKKIPESIASGDFCIRYCGCYLTSSKIIELEMN